MKTPPPEQLYIEVKKQQHPQIMKGGSHMRGLKPKGAAMSFALSLAMMLCGGALAIESPSGSNGSSPQEGQVASPTGFLGFTGQKTPQTTEKAATFRIEPSLYKNYTAALEAARKKAPDVKLIAIRNAAPIFPDHDFNWMYLFASAQTQMSYTVFVREETAVAADFGPYAISQAEFDGIQSADDIVYDADAAFQNVVYALPKDTKALEVDMYLLTYALGEERPTADAMLWFVEFNGSNFGKTDCEYPYFAYTVNALSGQTLEVLMD